MGRETGVFYDCIVITFCCAVSRNTCNQTKIAINGTETDYLQKSGVRSNRGGGLAPNNLGRSANVQDLILEWDACIDYIHHGIHTFIQR